MDNKARGPRSTLFYKLEKSGVLFLFDLVTEIMFHYKCRKVTIYKGLIYCLVREADHYPSSQDN